MTVGIENFKARCCYMDTKGRLTMTDICGYLLESADIHARNMGVGYLQMSQSGIEWVLSCLQIVGQLYPYKSCKLKEETWLVNCEKYFSSCDFEIKSTACKTRVAVVWGWILIDMKSKRPHLVDSFPVNIDYFPDRFAPKSDINKIKSIQNPELTKLYKVINCDFDMAKHVDTTQYN